MATASVHKRIEYDPEAVLISDLEPGDMAVFDSFFGIEMVASITNIEATLNGVKTRHIETYYILPNGMEHTTFRFLQRAAHEPITRWNPRNA